jgi:hypothetical protein
MIYLIIGRRQEIETAIRPFRTNSGQATVEYVLILVVTVTILLALISQVFSPMKVFLQSYMGDYVQCLLETGELPALNGESRIQDADSCESKFKPGSLKDGRPRMAGEGEPGSEDKEKNGGGSGGGGGGTYAGSSSRRNSAFSNTTGSRSAEVGSADPKVVEISIGATEEAGFRKGSGRSSFSRQTRKSYGQVITYSLSADDQEKLEKEAKTPSRIIASDLSLTPQKKMIVKAPAASKFKDSEDPQIGIGDYLRYFLIAAIIVILLVLLGGQAARLSKSWEK